MGGRISRIHRIIKKKKKARGGVCTVHLVQFCHYIDSGNEDRERGKRVTFTEIPVLANYVIYLSFHSSFKKSYEVMTFPFYKDGN